MSNKLRYAPGGDFLMLGIQVCATDQGRFFTSKNPEQAPIFEVLLQNTSWFLTFYSRTGSFLTIWVSNVKNDRSNPNFLSKNMPDAESVPITIISKFYSCCLQSDVNLSYSRKKNSIDKRIESFHYCSIIFEQRVPSFPLLGSVWVRTYVFLSEFNMTLPLWMTFIIPRSNQINKEYRVKSEQFISLSALPFHKEMQLINYQDLIQDTLFI